jgi:hypothetical protein
MWSRQVWWYVWDQHIYVRSMLLLVTVFKDDRSPYYVQNTCPRFPLDMNLHGDLWLYFYPQVPIRVLRNKLSVPLQISTDIISKIIDKTVIFEPKLSWELSARFVLNWTILFSLFRISQQSCFYGARLSALRPTPNLEDQVSVFMSPNDRVAQLHLQAPFWRLLRPAGLRWRYWNPPSYGVSTRIFVRYIM